MASHSNQAHFSAEDNSTTGLRQYKTVQAFHSCCFAEKAEKRPPPNMNRALSAMRFDQ